MLKQWMRISVWVMLALCMAASAPATAEPTKHHKHHHTRHHGKASHKHSKKHAKVKGKEPINSNIFDRVPPASKERTCKTPACFKKHPGGHYSSAKKDGESKSKKHKNSKHKHTPEASQ